ncbi:MAG: glycine--tRNA ligase subunit beta [Planctomycetes bacterium]|nr:glycine--tRNA ligase subunit beta [Planctomycetota bacterium]
MSEFLLEIGTEEVPAGYIIPALRQMEALFGNALKRESLEFGKVRTTGTPRRLVLWADGLPERQPDRVEEVSGPPAKVAFDDQGKPTKAAEGFAKGQGIPVDQIEVRETKKGPYCYAVKKVEGKSAVEILQGILPSLINQIGFPKSMVWTQRSEKKGGTFTFARPIRTLAALLGDDVVKITVAGVESGRLVNGHPFLSPDPIELASADLDAYKEALREAKVIVDLDERKGMIREQVMAILARYGREEIEQEDLLDEVTNLVEYPFAMEGTFDEEYLAIPDAVIEAAMMEHQRYFPVRNGEGKLEARFITVANRGGEHEGLIRAGNERVLRARLADARFFWDEDRKTKLEDRLEALKDVQFLGELGDQAGYYQKSQRLESLGSDFAREIGADQNAATHAAKHCKCDLVTSMVKEFPGLQGIMGGEYAREEGQPENVWKAIRDHYRPWSPSDSLPETPTGLAVSLADKMDNLASCFFAGKKPTGSADPFALRRQALAILRILEAKDLSIGLDMMVTTALSGLNRPQAWTKKSEILPFFRDRLYQVCVDRGARHDIVNAVLNAGFDKIPDFFKRLDVIVKESETDRWDDLVFLVQRCGNVAKIGKAAEAVDESLFEQDEEKALWSCYEKNKNMILALINAGDYANASAAYCEAFSEAVHEFFDKVFVNVENENVKKNRIRMVKEINELYTKHIADLGKIVISGDGAKP